MSKDKNASGDHPGDDGKDDLSVSTGDAFAAQNSEAEAENNTLTEPEPPVLDTPVAETAATPKTNKKSRKKSGWGRAFLWLFRLVVIAALGVGGYYGWDYVKQYLVEEKNTATALRALFEKQNAEIATLRQQLQAQSTVHQKLIQQQEGLSGLGKQWAVQEKRTQQQLAELDRRVASQGSRLRALSTTTRDDWLLAEAEYLLRLANQRLLTERTTENPVALLQTADTILKNLDDPALFAVRKQIASDITALKVAGKFDREGVYLQLASLSEVIPTLKLLVTPWQMCPPQAESPENMNAETEGESGWVDRLWNNAKQAFGGMSGYFRIRHRDQPIEPMPDAREELWLRQNLRLMLEQAQLALLREEQAIYQTSLQKSSEWLKSWFERNQQSEVLADQLLSLSKQSVTQSLPDISLSLDALRDYINLWHMRHEGGKSSPVGEDQ